MQFHIFHKDVDYPEGENAILEPEDADPRHQVKVLLLAHGGKTEVLKKALGLLPDGSTDDNHEVTSVFKQLQILVGEFNFVFHIYDKYSFQEPEERRTWPLEAVGLPRWTVLTRRTPEP